MAPKTVTKENTLKGQDLEAEAEVLVCSQRGLEAGTLETGCALQKVVADAYLTKPGRRA